MNFKKALKDTCFSVNLQGNTKSAIIKELVELMAAAGKIKDKQAALRCVLDREKKMSTGMQHGVAIPHGKTDEVDGLVAAVGLKKEGVDFGSQDGQPSRIFVMTISSTNRTGPHMEYLAEISRLLSNPLIRERVLEAKNAEDVVAVFTGEQP
jgi:mannitol/fructose-specific phosphotransferase system IIA component (Ntr-type)